MGLTHPITVLVPVRNGQETIEYALNDLLAGMDSQDELLVIDDGSEDSTPRILAEVSARDVRIRVLRTQGRGLVGALNLGLAEAAHSWIARADADDRYPMDRLQSQRAAVIPGAVLVTGDYQMVSGKGILGEIPCALTSPFVVASLIHPQRIPHPGVLINRQAVQSSGGYRQEDFPVEDLALWLRLSRAGTFVGTPELVVKWKMGGASITHTHQALQRKKTAELIQIEFPIEVLRSLSETDVRRELEAYSESRLGTTRRLLMYRDLRALQAKGLGTEVVRVARHAVVGAPWSSTRAGWMLLKEKHRRDRLRSRFEKISKAQRVPSAED